MKIKAFMLMACAGMSFAAKKPDVVITLEPPPETARELVMTADRIPAINVRLDYSTWLVFPHEKIIQIGSGDMVTNEEKRNGNFTFTKTDHVVSIKPALADRRTNLHVLTDKGIHSFTVSEVSSCKSCRVDLKVLVERDGQEEEKQKADENVLLRKQNDNLIVTVRLTKQQAAEVVEEATAAKRIAAEKSERAISAFKKEYPASQRCDYDFSHNKEPFEVGAICTDGTFTYVFSRSQGVQTIYAETPDGVSLVQFEYARGSSNHDGVYIINGIITRGYLQAGKKKRLKFQVKSTKLADPALQASR